MGAEVSQCLCRPLPESSDLIHLPLLLLCPIVSWSFSTPLVPTCSSGSCLILLPPSCFPHHSQIVHHFSATCAFPSFPSAVHAAFSYFNIVRKPQQIDQCSEKLRSDIPFAFFTPGLLLQHVCVSRLQRLLRAETGHTLHFGFLK